jgi:hypothetical protein
MDGEAPTLNTQKLPALPFTCYGKPGVTHNPDKPLLAYVNKLEDSFNQ